MSQSLARETGRFGIVGVASTLTHAGVALLAHALPGMTPTLANFTGFGVALTVSYLGHYHWTFASEAPHRSSLPRFLLISAALFLVSQVVVWLTTARLGYSMPIAAAFIVLSVPPASYFLNRLWTFGFRARQTA